MPIVGMSIGGSPLPSHVGEVAGLHSAPTPPQNTPRPTHACTDSMHWVLIDSPPSLVSGRQSHVDGSPGVTNVQLTVQPPAESTAAVAEPREQLQSARKQADGIWQPVTMMPWSGTTICEPHAPVATTSAQAAAAPRVQRMGRHLAVATRRKASPIAARLE